MQPQVIDEKAISYSQYKGSALVDIVLRDIPKVTVGGVVVGDSVGEGVVGTVQYVSSPAALSPGLFVFDPEHGTHAWFST